MPIEHPIIAVDLGKTRCRLAVIAADGRESYAGAGSPGLATSDGVQTALAAILPLLAQIGDIQRLSIGVAGAWSVPDAARELAARLAQSTGAAIAVTSDVVTAHAGALSGAPGTLLIAGTGAAALGADSSGVRLVDGWGPDLGDLGGGSWIGREGIRATLRARDGLGGPTVLGDAVRSHIAPAPDAVAWLAGDEPVARQLASVAPLVLDAAAAGDDVAAGIAAEAARLLTASAVAASDDADVVIHGGLGDHAWFRAELEHLLTSAGRVIVAAAGDALDGAALLARHTDMPHERFVHRA
ncbi:BadF/BadG/BcrA/BcrD ATPase family protein [Microbacterium sp. Bi121]|uniref:BadF/BadG/BcrA/BcrD ATPase family protein n=1 Tax=Microbacterium sp. Bi121 TaxID=2822348 RepID=UPI001DA89AF7|nr:BadF/BadG/BcrA/BcrD ATPase family protein [Microbacterium sp. Bi121]CAH0127246.1 N-acetylmuramic acid/N-acetylglucosamine kinase [Microbacterium sp. Bi121]